MKLFSDSQSIFEKLKSAQHRFAKDETGAVLVFALVLFVLMVMMGGLAVDLMRYETTRTTLQNTLDRSTLAAASLSQTLDPEDVVRDYFSKAGMSEYLTAVKVDEGLNFRQVHADAMADAKPMFLHMIGINDLEAGGASTAEQRTNNLEISLVLDVSGSMGGAKIANLKLAAAEFVDTVLSSDADHRISISIVPYNAQVNVGPTLRAKYTAAYDNDVADSSCYEIPPAMYSAPGLSNTTPIPMMAHADFSYNTDKVNSAVSPTSASYAVPNFSNVYCRTLASNIIRVPSQDIIALKAQINGLEAGGNTSIMTGMKWGLALVDPAAKSMFTSLISEGKMPSTLRDRPFAYNDAEAVKVIVLMTDGEHVSHDRVNDSFKAGASPIYLSSGDGNYSVYDGTRSGNKYWTPHRSEWRAAAWNSGAGVAQQDWRDVWKKLKVSYVAWQFYARATGSSNSDRNTKYTTKMNEIRGTFADVATMNAQLQQSCSLAKTNGVIVYGIAFEAPTNGQTQISNCSTSSSHYFNASGLQIRTAFRAIATNISQLRLTQ